MEDTTQLFAWKPYLHGVRLVSFNRSRASAFIRVPSVIDGKQVLSLGKELFANCGHVRGLELPETLTAIEERAFYNCAHLVEVNKSHSELKVNLPDGVRQIGASAFERCGLIETIKMPIGIQQIGEGAFSKCRSLTQIGFHNCLKLRTIGARAFQGCARLELFMPSQCRELREIGENAFADCVKMTHCEIPSSVETIEPGAFSRCLKLQDFALSYENPFFSKRKGILFSKDFSTLYCYPAGRNDSFYSPPEETTAIAPQAFEGANMIYSVSLTSVRAIGDGAFRGCYSLASVELGDEETTLGPAAFEDCSALERVKLSRKTTTIPPRLFSRCTSLTKIDLPHEVTSVGDGAFEDCSSLAEVKFHNKVRKIGDNAFNGCLNLCKLELPANLETIGDGAFENCSSNEKESSLRVVVIPEGVRSIGAWAFSDCFYLESVELPKSLKYIGVGAFAFCNLLSHLEIDKDNPNYETIGSTLFTKGLKKLLSYPVGRPARVYVVPEEVEEIGDHAFAFCENLTELTLPKALKKIGHGAFGGCSIKTFESPEAIERIPDGAFWNCRYLKTVRLTENVREIGARAFRNCGITKIQFPQRLETIEDDAFYGCKELESVTIPRGTRFVASTAFDQCAKLTSIEVESGSATYVSKDGVLFTRDGSELVTYPGGKPCETYVVPTSTRSIATNAFAAAPVKALVIPRDVERIGPGAISQKTEVRVFEKSYAHGWATCQKLRVSIIS